MLFQRIKIFLDRQNIEHRNISDTMLVFSKNGLNYLFQHDQSEDENYFRLILPQIDRVETLPDSMFRTIAQINANYKVAKIIEVEGSLWISAEAFVFDQNNLDNLFSAFISILQAIIEDYRGKKREQQTQQRPDQES